ncbi:MAG: hypothetical protein ABIH23_09710, partial [bacterium]
GGHSMIKGSIRLAQLFILISVASSSVCPDTYIDHFPNGVSELGFVPRQPLWAASAVDFITADDTAWGYSDQPMSDNPSGDQTAMRVGNLDGIYYGVAEATLMNNELGRFEELSDVRIEAWVYCLAPIQTQEESALRARVGFYIRDTSDNHPDSMGNGEESYPPQVHYDSSIYAGPGFGTTGFVTALADARGNLTPPAGSEGYILLESNHNGETRINDVFNRTVLTENRWIKMFAHIVGSSLTVGADLDGDGEFEPGPPGDSEVAFYPDIRNYDVNGKVVDPNDIGRVGCFAIVTNMQGEPLGVLDTPAFFDDVTITGDAAITDWPLH